MKYKTLSLKLASLIVLGFMLFSALATPVFAQATECPNPGPYGVCPPDTDLVIGSVVISDETLALIVLSYALGIGLMVNSSVISSKLQEFKQSRS